MMHLGNVCELKCDDVTIVTQKTKDFKGGGDYAKVKCIYCFCLCRVRGYIEIES